MGRVQIVQTNFTSGELSPRMYGRTDVARYNNAAKLLENVIPLIHGGAMRRDGTRYITSTKDSAKVSRLIPYIFSRSQAYMLELGDLYLRVFQADGTQVEVSPGVPYEIATPYTEAQLAAITVCHRADTMFLWHEDVYPQRLQRFAATDWRIQNAPFNPEPFDELGDLLTQTGTLSLATVGAGRTLTISGAYFLAGDVGREVSVAGGLAVITGWTSTTVVTVDITSTFASTVLAANTILVGQSSQATITPSAKDPVGATISLTASVAAWRATDVGKHVVLNGGLVRITGYTSTTVVSAVILVELAAVTAVVGSAWVLCRSMWGQEFGYPRTGTFYQQRLWAGGSPGFPQSVWMSRLAEYYSFEIGTLPDSGFEASIDSDQVNPVRHLASVRALAALCETAEFTITGSKELGVRPDTLDIQNQSAFGCNDVPPIRVGNELAFFNESGRKMRALSADRFDASNFAAPDITVLSEHITETGIIDLEKQTEPESLVWALRADGQIATCTLDRDNDVVAWARQITDGVFESIAMIPYNGRHVMWAIVNRTIDGDTLRSVEIFEPDLYSDATVIGVEVSASDVWTGLDHLEGKTVAVRLDGIVQPDAVVVGGSITTQRTGFRMEAGLPFLPKVHTMTPEVQGPGGSAQALQMRTVNVTIKVKDTIGANINGRDIPFAQFGGNLLDEVPTPYSGDKDITTLGYERGTSELIITQPQALPFHLLAIVRKFEVNG